MEQGTQKINIAFVTPQISRSKGGIQSLSYLMAEVFPQKMRFHTYCAKDSEVIENENGSVTYSCYNQRQTIRFHISLIYNVLRDYRLNKYSFSYASLYSYSLSCYLLKKIKSVPYGIMIHGNELLNEPLRDSFRGRVIALIKKRLREVLFKKADIIFANSTYTKELYEEKYGKKEIFIIHPPIRFLDKHISENIEKRRFILLSIGRIVKRKGFQYVIEAMRSLSKDIPQIKYYIAGDGPYLEHLRELVCLYGLQDSITLFGRVTESEKDKLYEECDYFVMPSFIIENEAEVEGFGMVYIEANMYGKYVIATRSGGIPDAVIDGVTGSFVLPQSSESIATTIKNMYNCNSLYSPRKCAEWAKEMDINHIGQLYSNAINMIISRNM